MTTKYTKYTKLWNKEQVRYRVRRYRFNDFYFVNFVYFVVKKGFDYPINSLISLFTSSGLACPLVAFIT